MNSEKNNQVKVGDWVKLKSSKGERIYGYVEKKPVDNELVQLRVVSSENELISGQSIQVLMHKVQKQETKEQHSVSELKQLIDLALLTNDETWFDALMEQYQALKVKQK